MDSDERLRAFAGELREKAASELIEALRGHETLEELIRRVLREELDARGLGEPDYEGVGLPSPPPVPGTLAHTIASIYAEPLETLRDQEAAFLARLSRMTSE